MFRGSIKGIIVGNASNELLSLKPSKTVFRADKPAASGIIEGLIHYNFLPNSVCIQEQDLVTGK